MGQENLEAFERMIREFPKNSRVLDVGYAGHDGENTSNYLAAYFDRVVGITNSTTIANNNKKDNCEIIIDNFYNYRFNQQFDLVVLDLDIENNLLRDWRDGGLERVAKLLAPGGHLINYVMTTDQYGDPDQTPDLIRWHSERFWGTPVPTNEAIGERIKRLRGWELCTAKQEKRRPYITWVMLKKTNGS